MEGGRKEGGGEGRQAGRREWDFSGFFGKSFVSCDFPGSHLMRGHMTFLRKLLVRRQFSKADA